MRTKLFGLFMLLSLAASIQAQTTPTPVDCQFSATFTATSLTTPSYYNKGPSAPCIAWRLTYATVNATGVSISLQGTNNLPNGNPDPAGWTNLTVTAPVTNPATGTAAGTIAACCDYYPWIRAIAGTFTGAAQTMSLTVLGYKGTSASRNTGGGGGYTLPTATDLILGGVTMSTSTSSVAVATDDPRNSNARLPSAGTVLVAQKFFGTAAPGSVATNLPGDLYTDTTAHSEYVCNAPAGTAAPACTAVVAAGWLLLNQPAGSVNLQSATPGTPQTGNSNISGTGIFGTGLLFGTNPISFGAGTQPLYNMWIGAYGSANTTGSNNSAQGVRALYSNTTGSNNSAQGYGARYSNTTGNNNSAQGANALYFNTTGNSNSAHGFYALISNTTGNSNSAHGFAALVSNTTGNNNSAQGFQAGYTATPANANVSGSNNSWFGYQSGPGSPTQYNYQSAIGATATATCSNCVVLGRAGGLDTVYAGDAGVDPMVVLALATTPVLTTNLKTCTASTGIPWRASVTDAVAPAVGVALTGGGLVFANVHCSLTTGTYIVDGI